MVRGLDHLFARRPLRRGDHLREDRVRRAHFFDGLTGRWEARRCCGRGAPAPAAERCLGPNRQLLDFADAPVDDLEPHRDSDQCAVRRALASLAHRADERDLLRLDVGNVELVAAFARHSEPQALIAEWEANAVLGELGVAREELPRSPRAPPSHRGIGRRNRRDNFDRTRRAAARRAQVTLSRGETSRSVRFSSSKPSCRRTESAKRKPNER